MRDVRGLEEARRWSACRTARAQERVGVVFCACGEEGPAALLGLPRVRFEDVLCSSGLLYPLCYLRGAVSSREQISMHVVPKRKR